MNLSMTCPDRVLCAPRPVVEDLRALWEEKLLQTGVLDAPSPEEYEE